MGTAKADKRRTENVALRAPSIRMFNRSDCVRLSASREAGETRGLAVVQFWRSDGISTLLSHTAQDQGRRNDTVPDRSLHPSPPLMSRLVEICGTERQREVESVNRRWAVVM
jgi:hypothetical protein